MKLKTNLEPINSEKFSKMTENKIDGLDTIFAGRDTYPTAAYDGTVNHDDTWFGIDDKYWASLDKRYVADN